MGVGEGRGKVDSLTTPSLLDGCAQTFDILTYFTMPFSIHNMESNPHDLRLQINSDITVMLEEKQNMVKLSRT